MTAPPTSKAQAASTSARRIPFRSTGLPSCGHKLCLGRPAPAPPAEDPRGAEPRTSGFPQWLGACGVATIFYRLGASPSPDRTVGAAVALRGSASELLAPAVTPAQPSTPTTPPGGDLPASPAAAAAATTQQQQSQPQQSPPRPPAYGDQLCAIVPPPPLTFLLGYDRIKRKVSICTGTMQDSWNEDSGCAVAAAVRECREEFKFEFASLDEFVRLVRFHWWSASTLCCAICLDDLRPDDPRGSLPFLQSKIDAALKDPNSSSCEREVTTLTWHAVADPTRPVGGAGDCAARAGAVAPLSVFGSMCMEAARHQLFRTAPSAYSDGGGRGSGRGGRRGAGDRIAPVGGDGESSRGRGRGAGVDPAVRGRFRGRGDCRGAAAAAAAASIAEKKQRNGDHGCFFFRFGSSFPALVVAPRTSYACDRRGRDVSERRQRMRTEQKRDIEKLAKSIQTPSSSS